MDSFVVPSTKCYRQAYPIRLQANLVTYRSEALFVEGDLDIEVFQVFIWRLSLLASILVHCLSPASVHLIVLLSTGGLLVLRGGPHLHVVDVRSIIVGSRCLGRLSLLLHHLHHLLLLGLVLLCNCSLLGPKLRLLLLLAPVVCLQL